MILIAVGLSFMILAMAALAIDLVALYSAHNDARLAADAAALAGAKAIANSGYTTDQGTIPWATIQPIAAALATTVATQNKIAGQPILAGNVTVNIPAPANPTNPQVSVTVKATGVPAFFSRIWGNTALPVAATSNAEAYNPGYPSNNLPVQPQCVKPWLLPNLGLDGNSNIFNPATGTPNLTDNQLGIPYPLTPTCAGPGGCSGQPTVSPTAAHYLPASLDAPTTVPACAPDSCSYEQNIAACSPQPVSCSSSTSLQQVSIDATSCGAINYTNTGTECLIRASGSGMGLGQDCMGADGPGSCSSAAPIVVTQMFAGANNRLISNGINVGDLISTSDSLVTIPVFNFVTGQPPIPTASPVNIIGFVQAFVTSVNSSTGAITIRIVNIAGCSDNVAGSPPVQGDSISPVPVHLISN